MNTPLDVAVREALQSRRGEWKQIASQSGVSYSWISKFVNGHIPNPGFATLRDLHIVLDTPPALSAPTAAAPAAMR